MLISDSQLILQWKLRLIQLKHNLVQLLFSDLSGLLLNQWFKLFYQFIFVYTLCIIENWDVNYWKYKENQKDIGNHLEWNTLLSPLKLFFLHWFSLLLLLNNPSILFFTYYTFFFLYIWDLVLIIFIFYWLMIAWSILFLIKVGLSILPFIICRTAKKAFDGIFRMHDFVVICCLSPFLALFNIMDFFFFVWN
jgi:hypothetical protein